MKSWTLWYDRKDIETKDENWEQFLIKICKIREAKGFWETYDALIRPEDLPINSNLHFFKTGIEPKWEDLENFYGGRWVITMKRDQIIQINDVWKSTLLGLVSNFDMSDNFKFINGAVLSSKKFSFRISLWTKLAKCKEIQISIANYWKNIIINFSNINSLQIDYFPHRINQVRPINKAWSKG